LEAAANLASTLQSELLGLFVEDLDLLHLAQLPFAQEVSLPAARMQRLSFESMQRQFMARAASARHELEEAAEKNRLRYKFRVVRGLVDSEVLQAALDVDLLALGWMGHSMIASRRRRIGSTARSAISRARSSVLLVRPGMDLKLPVVALYDGSEAGLRAVAIAATLAQYGGEVRILIWGADDETAYRLHQQVIVLLQDLDATVKYQHFHDQRPQDVVELIEKQGGGLLVFGATGSLLPAEVVDALLEDTGMPILAAR
jgi:nucleotide-binding universal stress UspA family protein